MLYILSILSSYNRKVSCEDLTFTSPGQIADYIRSYIDQPHIQDLLADIEYAELDLPKDDFLPLPDEIDAACDAAHNHTATVFEAGEEVGSAQLFGVMFTVTRQGAL